MTVYRCDFKWFCQLSENNRCTMRNTIAHNVRFIWTAWRYFAGHYIIILIISCINIIYIVRKLYTYFTFEMFFRKHDFHDLHSLNVQLFTIRTFLHVHVLCARTSFILLFKCCFTTIIISFFRRDYMRERISCNAGKTKKKKMIYYCYVFHYKKKIC